MFCSIKFIFISKTTTYTINKKGLEESYMVSYRVARTGKPHTIVEDLILPAAADMAGTMLGEKDPKNKQTMSSSNNTVSRCISDMAGDILKQLLLCIQDSELYVLQLDEPTDVAGLAPLLVYVCYVYGGSIKEGILFLLDSFVTSNELCIHREALVAKGMPDSLKDILDTTMKRVNFVIARPLNSCIFSTLCNDMGSDHVMLLQHTEVCWLSRGKVLTRFLKLRDKLKVFFTDHNFHLSDRLHDDEFLTRLAHLGDVFSRLNDRNPGLQGLSATIFNVRDKTETMIKKLELFSVCINKDNTQVFPSLYDLLCANELKLTDNSQDLSCNVTLPTAETHNRLCQVVYQRTMELGACPIRPRAVFSFGCLPNCRFPVGILSLFYEKNGIKMDFKQRLTCFEVR
uniref:DUF4371 domain-containing protein n=1 Tax=Salmo trutta TaxID=8032 RepID=A0A674C2Q6_SALTR